MENIDRRAITKNVQGKAALPAIESQGTITLISLGHGSTFAVEPLRPPDPAGDFNLLKQSGTVSGIR